MTERSIIAHNFKLMFSAENGGMQLLAQKESMSGNAGTEKIRGKTYACVAANFYFNADTGEMIEFSNGNPKYESVYAKAAFRACIMPLSMMKKLDELGAFTEEMGCPVIVNVVYFTDASKNAKKLIKDSMKVYNAVVEAHIRK